MYKIEYHKKAVKDIEKLKSSNLEKNAKNKSANALSNILTFADI